MVCVISVASRLVLPVDCVLVWLSVDLPRLAQNACAFSGSACQQLSACVLALLVVQVDGRGQPMHAEISGDDPACMPDCAA
jgi:hypothetical protein